MKKSYKSTLGACYLGYITQAITVNLATLFFVIFNTDFDVSYAKLGNLVLITFITQIIVDASMVKLTYVIGYRASAVAAHAVSAAGLIMLGILPYVMDAYTGIVISVIFYAIGGGMTEVVISPIVDSLPGDAKASGMCLLHSFYSWGQLFLVAVSTVALRIIGGGMWFMLPICWSAVPLFNMFFFMRVPLLPIPPEARGTHLSEYFKSPVMYISVLLMVCGGASEMAMSQWASLFAEEALGISKVVGDLLGPCLFALCMGTGRVLYGLFGHKINIKKALVGCSILTLLCYALTVFASLPIFSLAGCALCGFGVSLMWPGILSMTSAFFGDGSSPALFAFLALAGDVGCSLGPWLTGSISDLMISHGTSAALRAGLASAAVFPTAMILLSVIMLFMKENKKI